MLTGGVIQHTVTQRVDWYGTLRGRAGYAVWDGMLPFLTGGFAYGQVSSSANVLFPPSCCAGDNYSGQVHQVRPGWTVGAGLDYALPGNWVIRAEYLYIDLGTSTYTAPITNPAVVGGITTASYQSAVSHAQHVIRLAMNYRFGAPPPPPPALAMPAVTPPPPVAPPARQTFIVFFDFDKSTLTAEGSKIVDAAAAAFKSGKSNIAIAGYTDLAGTATYNMALSERRAKTVQAALIKDGVPANAIATSWHGKENPRVKTADGVREAQNRRVEINM